MRIPLSWLREFVDIPVSPEQLAERLTLAGLEVASIDYIGTVAPEKSPWAPELDKPVPPDSIPWDAERVLVGELLEVRQHPNADRLTVPLPWAMATAARWRSSPARPTCGRECVATKWRWRSTGHG